jgi:two-component system sensor histidine kinase RpfC
MSAQEAATYSEKKLRGVAGIGCPWVVISSCFTNAQRTALVNGGAAALMNSSPSAEELFATLGSLVHRIEVQTTSAEDVSQKPSSGSGRRLSILLADDNASNRMLLSRILTGAGHGVVEAERGDQAFDMMAAGGLDIALLDLNMPDMSGPDVVKLFRAASVGGGRFPIVVLSADATPAAKQESLDAGANDFLTKPVTAQALFATIERLVAGTTHRRPAPVQSAVEHPRQVTATVPQLIDPEQVQALRRIARGDQKFLDQYITAALSELEKAISDLRIAATGNQERDARAALHIIEGTGGSIGATALVANCKSMRAYITVPEDPDCAGALAEISTIMALTKSAVLAVLQDSSNLTASRIGLSN